VRTCADPRQAILDFLGAAYRVATTLGGWDAASHEYIRPAASPRGRHTREETSWPSAST